MFDSSPAAPGFSLVEVILAAALLALITSAWAGSFWFGYEATLLAAERTRAVALAEEGLEAVRNLRDQSFANLVPGTYGVTTTGNQWQLSGAADTIGMFTRSVALAALSASTTRVTATVTWQHRPAARSVTLTADLTDWR
ncbi:MAG: prepilin-type N-terminal cleavage/methylation domain-containing protein [Candidatus Magasanikbacteria bacterium]|nr:prepilin-type N-terminal cleavage/methylation domain-containing protein [Candidatus Magasanikbacteria bacterium]